MDTSKLKIEIDIANKILYIQADNTKIINTLEIDLSSIKFSQDYSSYQQHTDQLNIRF